MWFGDPVHVAVPVSIYLTHLTMKSNYKFILYSMPFKINVFLRHFTINCLRFDGQIDKYDFEICCKIHTQLSITYCLDLKIVFQKQYRTLQSG